MLLLYGEMISSRRVS
jgi:hypothetical protein